MHYIACLFVCLITTPATTGLAMSSSSSASNCSSFTASSNTLPMMLLNSKYLTGELQLGEDSTIRKQSPQPTTFRARCMAPYPIKMEINFPLKDKTQFEQGLDDQVANYTNATGLFSDANFFHFRLKEEPWFNTSCASSCEPSQFPFRVTLFTVQDPEDVNKLRVRVTSVKQLDKKMKKVQPKIYGKAKIDPWIKIIIWSTLLTAVMGISVLAVIFFRFIFQLRQVVRLEQPQHQQRVRVLQEPEEFEMEDLFR